MVINGYLKAGFVVVVDRRSARYIWCQERGGSPRPKSAKIRSERLFWLF